MLPSSQEKRAAQQAQPHKIKAHQMLEETQIAGLAGPGARLLRVRPPAPR